MCLQIYFSIAQSGLNKFQKIKTFILTRLSLSLVHFVFRRLNSGRVKANYILATQLRQS